VALAVAAAAAWQDAPAVAADAPAPLVLESAILLADVSGRIDHMAIDLRRRHLSVAELGNDTVDIVDLPSGRVIRRLAGLQEPQGVAFVSGVDLLAVASGGDGSVRFFHAADFSPAGRIDLGDDADNVRLDPRTGGGVVGFGTGALAIIDPGRVSVLATVSLAVHPEGFQLAPDGSRAFVNLPDANQVAVVDLVSRRQAARWSLGDLHSNFPLAIDAAGTTVAIAFRGPPRLVLFDARSGAIAAVADACGDADDVFFDAGRHRLYVSCGDGAIDVFEWNDAHLQPVGRRRRARGRLCSSRSSTGCSLPRAPRRTRLLRRFLSSSDAMIWVDVISVPGSARC
jgi:hypothetical protein